ncbi:hypothetical protein ACP70R_048646 [Stipagrostis hirtigluma subsp. patula]
MAANGLVITTEKKLSSIGVVEADSASDPIELRMYLVHSKGGPLMWGASSSTARLHRPTLKLLLSEEAGGAYVGSQGLYLLIVEGDHVMDLTYLAFLEGHLGADAVSDRYTGLTGDGRRGNEVEEKNNASHATKEEEKVEGNSGVNALEEASKGELNGTEQSDYYMQLQLWPSDERAVVILFRVIYRGPTGFGFGPYCSEVNVTRR